MHDSFTSNQAYNACLSLWGAAAQRSGCLPGSACGSVERAQKADAERSWRRAYLVPDRYGAPPDPYVCPELRGAQLQSKNRRLPKGNPSGAPWLPKLQVDVFDVPLDVPLRAAKGGARHRLAADKYSDATSEADDQEFFMDPKLHYGDSDCEEDDGCVDAMEPASLSVAIDFLHEVYPWADRSLVKAVLQDCGDEVEKASKILEEMQGVETLAEMQGGANGASEDGEEWSWVASEEDDEEWTVISSEDEECIRRSSATNDYDIYDTPAELSATVDRQVVPSEEEALDALFPALTCGPAALAKGVLPDSTFAQILARSGYSESGSCSTRSVIVHETSSSLGHSRLKNSTLETKLPAEVSLEFSVEDTESSAYFREQFKFPGEQHYMNSKLRESRQRQATRQNRLDKNVLLKNKVSSKVELCDLPSSLVHPIMQEHASLGDPKKAPSIHQTRHIHSSISSQAQRHGSRKQAKKVPQKHGGQQRQQLQQRNHVHVRMW